MSFPCDLRERLPQEATGHSCPCALQPTDYAALHVATSQLEAPVSNWRFEADGLRPQLKPGVGLPCMLA